jgi:hypothetical protein
MMPPLTGSGRALTGLPNLIRNAIGFKSKIIGDTIKLSVGFACKGRVEYTPKRTVVSRIHWKLAGPQLP